MKRIGDFSASDREVIKERAKFQSNVELGAVFDCDPRTIAAIVRGTNKAPPLSKQDMRELYASGETVAEIARMARVRNGLTKPEVREIVFGEAA